MRIRRVHSLLALAICLGAVGCRSASEKPPEPAKEVARLGVLLGKWKSHSHHLARNLAGGVPDSDVTFTCSWTDDRNYMACAQMGEISGKKVKEADIFGYSTLDKKYTMVVVVNVADAPPQVFSNWFSWEGNQWTFVPRDGVRSFWELQSPDRHVTRTEHTEDGKRWDAVSVGEHTRIY